MIFRFSVVHIFHMVAHLYSNETAGFNEGRVFKALIETVDVTLPLNGAGHLLVPTQQNWCLPCVRFPILRMQL
jgi:hypothetical protein